MMASRPSCPLSCPSQSDLDTFGAAGIPAVVLARPEPVQVARGDVAPDGLFDPDEEGPRWFAVAEADDIVFWRGPPHRIASWAGRAFALGQQRINAAATYSFDCALNIFATPGDWLRARRDGIVILPNRWTWAFDRLRDVPRIAIAEELLPLYRVHMRPARMPDLFVITGDRRAA